MPAGLSWPRYFTFFAASLASMLAGAALVHNVYKPSLEIPEVPPDLVGKSDEEQTGWRKFISIK